MYEFSKKNAQQNSLDVAYYNTSLQDFSSEKKFDYIISNPPFYDSNSSKSQNDSLKIARYDTLLDAQDLVKKVNALLSTNGSFIFCYEAKRLSILTEVLSQYKFYINTLKFVHSKIQNEAGLVLVCAKKIKSKYVKVLPPFFSTVDGESSQEFLKASKRARTRSVT